MKKSTSNKFIIISMTIIIVLCGIYIVRYRMWEESDVGNIDITEYLEKEKNEYQEVEDNTNYAEIAESLYNKVNFKMIEENFGEEFIDMYYQGEISNTESFTDEFIIYLGIINIKEEDFLIKCNNSENIDKITLDKKIKELFGNNVKYENKSFKIKGGLLEVVYDENSDAYIVSNNSCSGIQFGENHIETKFMSGELVDNNIEVIESIYYLSYVLNSDGSYTLNYHSGIDINSPVVAQNELNDSAAEKLNKYKYTFSKDINNNYFLSKIEKVKDN